MKKTAIILLTILATANFTLANPIPLPVPDCWPPKIICSDDEEDEDDVHPEKCDISGYILTSDGSGVPGVTVRADNGGSSTTTASSGYYRVRVPYEWSGRVTPSRSEWTFDPPPRSYSYVTSNRSNQNYTGYGPERTISGYIRTLSGSGVPGVTVRADNGGSSTTRSSTGYYSVLVPYEWSGRVTPSKSGWTFSPSSRSYPNVTSNWNNQNYTGTPPPTEITGLKWNDLNGDGIRDAGEPKLANWKIYLDSNQNGQWELGEPYRITNANGQYSFPDLPAGTYHVAEELKSGWQQTYPSTGQHTVTLSAGLHRGQIDFGNKRVESYPRPEMSLEDIDVEIKPAGGELHAVFTGDFTFNSIPDFMNSMLFPVPPDAHNIRVWQDDQELPWTWSNLRYPTVLPEMETIPMIEWQGPFPRDGAIFGVHYEHNLIKRPDEFIFFYALGTGSYTPSDGTIAITTATTTSTTTTTNTASTTITTAYFDILVPTGYRVKGVWFDNIPTNMYEVIDSHLRLTVESPSHDLIVSLARPYTIYVDDDAIGANNGISWEDAYRYLQDALAVASSGYEIRVAQGTYKPDRGVGISRGERAATFRLKNGVTIKGGYAGVGKPNPNACDIDLYETILSGDLNGNDVEVTDPCDLPKEPTRVENSYHVITGSRTNETAVLDSFIITGGLANGSGYHNYGAGIYNDLGSPTLINCTFSGNSAIEGGGMENWWQSSPILNNCTFVGNSANSRGGGMENWWQSSPILTNCTFKRNYSGGVGAAMSNDYSDPNLTNCIFGNNSAIEHGGGMFNDNSSPILTNCTFSENSAPNGSALACDSWQQRHPSNLQVANCILWNGGNEIWNNDNSTIVINYSNVYGGFPGEGNIEIEPLFAYFSYWDPSGSPVDPNDDFWVEGDYHLKSQAGRWDPISQAFVHDDISCLCIDAGDPFYPVGDEPEPNGQRINMGAYGGTAEASKSFTR